MARAELLDELEAEVRGLQPSGGQAKPYELRQLLELVERHALRLKEDDQ